MTIQDELIVILNQIPAAIEKAFYEAMVLRHPGHANQKTHGNRFGVGQAKESFRRLKDDKAARERYKATARKRGQGSGGGSQALKSVENEIRNQDFETAAVFDKNGKMLFRKDGGKDYVSFTDEEVTLMKGAIVTHNHPSGGSFSREDGIMLANGKLREIRAVGKEWEHSLKMPPGDNTRGSMVDVTVQDYDSRVKAEFWTQIREWKITPEQASREHWHEVWTRSSKELGFIYERKAVK